VRPLPVSFFRRPADVVAPDLLGATIVSSLGGATTSGMIVETEAYLGYDDPAAHAYRGRRHAGNQSIYGPPGTWYVYLSYGIHWCANLVCEGPGAGGAVLLRALVPMEGLEAMRRRRGAVGDARIADGPGKLCQALGITRELDGRAMRDSGVLVGRGSAVAARSVVITPRIGITKATDLLLRYLLRPDEVRLPPPATASGRAGSGAAPGRAALERHRTT
jgi:DNA-3-methyladenine glycosylase